METRVLIPNGLKIVVSHTESSTLKEKSQESDEDQEEKPSSSSGYFETIDQDQKPPTSSSTGIASTPNFLSSEDEQTQKNNTSETETSENEISSESEEETGSSDLIGSSEANERGRKRKRGGKQQQRKAKKKLSGTRKGQGDLKTPVNISTKIKICATRVIDKGTVFSANDGDVQVVHLTGIRPIPKDDVRFLFGCFESISEVSCTSQPEISSASVSDTASENNGERKLIRLCNWIRFLPTTSTLRSTDEQQIEKNETIAGDKGGSSLSNINLDNESCEKLPNSGNNVIARFVDGRPIFEVIARLVPGTELVASFDMNSFITQTSTISPLATMMMISNMQMGLMQPLPPSDNISSSTPTPISTPSSSSSSSALISSSSMSSSTVAATAPSLSLFPFHTAGFGFVGGNDFVPPNGAKNERDEKEPHHRIHQHYYQGRLLQFYQNTFQPPSLHRNFHHIQLGVEGGGAVADLTSSKNGLRTDHGGRMRDGLNREERKDEGSDKRDGRQNEDEARTNSDRPLDLSKSLSVSPSPSNTNLGLQKDLTGTFPGEHLKIGTPFDSPDSNGEGENSLKIRGTSNSSPIFSIRNVLRKPPSHKLFQPYSLDRTNSPEDEISKGSKNTSVVDGHGFRTSSLSTSTPPSSSDSTLLLRSSPAIRPILRTRGKERSLLPCEVCGKAFDRPSLLKRHLRTHTGEKPHICDVCSKGFSTSSSLNTHRRIHSGEKPHQCPVCQKRFTASSNLYYHRMTHNKEKPHKCMLCGKSFPTPGDLKSHQYVHSGSWPYTCPVCHRGFSKQTNLRNHLVLHSGTGNNSQNSKLAKSHACRICDKKFAQACNLRAHIRSHEEESEGGRRQELQSWPCSSCKQKLPESMLVGGKCRSCYLNAGNTTDETSETTFENSSVKHTFSSPPAVDSFLFSRKNQFGSSQFPKLQNIFDQSIASFGSTTADSSSNKIAPPSQTERPSFLHGMPPILNTFPSFGSFTLPQLSGFSIPTGLGLQNPSLTPPSPGVHFPLAQTVTPNSTSTSTMAAAAAAAAAANLLRSSSGAGETTPSLQTNAVLEQILEWNYRVAKESAGNLSLNLVQQKLLESHVLAAQLMSQHQQTAAGGTGNNNMFAVNAGTTVHPFSANFQEYFKMRVAGMTPSLSGYPKMETISPENKFVQR